jgi:hypothetical protein
MKSWKIVTLTILTLLLIGFLFLRQILQFWLNENLESIINRGDNRAYSVSFRSITLDAAFKGLTLNDAKINPVNASMNNKVYGQVESIGLHGFSWFQLGFNRHISVEQIHFKKPVFNALLGDKVSSKETRLHKEVGFQQLFMDILSGADLSDLLLENGSISIRRVVKTDTILAGSIRTVNFRAQGIETDSVMLKFPIPFHLNAFSAQIRELNLPLEGSRELLIGEIRFDSRKEEFTLTNVLLHYTESVMGISNAMKQQVDIIELEADTVRVSKLDAVSGFFGEEIDIRAQNMILDGVTFRDFRNKNIPRPPDVEKPMFSGWIDQINIPLRIDTLQVKNSEVFYSELLAGKEKAGTVHFSGIYGSIYNITTIDEFQDEYGLYEADIMARVGSSGRVSVRLEVPYNEEKFLLSTTVKDLKLEDVSPEVEPMTGVKFQGEIHRLFLQMDANQLTSVNQLEMDYDQLHLEVEKETTQHHIKKDPILTIVANMAIRNKNDPSHKNYIKADYVTDRNIYRGPFNFIWLTIKDGSTYILPIKSVRKLLHRKEKSNS